mmetsp:Transcript_6114/g.5469  ORF Transcript_6114/g.5469 Transcript_6114/m.5469 type:complete len:136 (+) Transcript_6114:3246-3653(+)
MPKLDKKFSELRNQKMSLDDLFALICERNKKVINIMIKKNFSLLNESMSMITKKAPKILEFEIRRSYFRAELQKMKQPGALRLRIRRNRMMENSFNQMHTRPINDLKRKVHIEFIGEEGIDAGGLMREWYLELSR